MRRTSPLLDFASRNSRLMAWLSLYAIFTIMGLRVAPSLWVSVISSTVTIVPMVVVSETMRRVLIPHLFGRHTLSFVLLTLLLLVGMVQLSVWCDKTTIANLGLPMPGRRDGNMGNPDIYFRLKYSFLLIVTIAQATIFHLLTERKKIIEDMHEEQMQMELRYLRSQANPHFLFNALNSLYALATMHDERTPDAVLQLSEMMRYTIEESMAERVQLKKELRYVENYIAFYRLRLNDEADLTFEVNLDSRTSPPDVPPMVLQPMVENALKHSRIAERRDAFVHIRLMQYGRKIVFTTANSCDPAHPVGESERLGIGMANTRKRLSLLYGDDYELRTWQDGNTYRMRLVVGTDEA